MDNECVKWQDLSVSPMETCTPPTDHKKLYKTMQLCFPNMTPEHLNDLVQSSFQQGHAYAVVECIGKVLHRAPIAVNDGKSPTPLPSPLQGTPSKVKRKLPGVAQGFSEELDYGALFTAHNTALGTVVHGAQDISPVVNCEGRMFYQSSGSWPSLGVPGNVGNPEPVHVFSAPSMVSYGVECNSVSDKKRMSLGPQLTKSQSHPISSSVSTQCLPTEVVEIVHNAPFQQALEITDPQVPVVPSCKVSLSSMATQISIPLGPQNQQIPDEPINPLLMLQTAPQGSIKQKLISQGSKRKTAGTSIVMKTCPVKSCSRNFDCLREHTLALHLPSPFNPAIYIDQEGRFKYFLSCLWTMATAMGTENLKSFLQFVAKKRLHRTFGGAPVILSGPDEKMVRAFCCWMKCDPGPGPIVMDPPAKVFYLIYWEIVLQIVQYLRRLNGGGFNLPDPPSQLFPNKPVLAPKNQKSVPGGPQLKSDIQQPSVAATPPPSLVPSIALIKGMMSLHPSLKM